MKQPDGSDRVVKVRAYLTDETFGYDHWRAAQFCAPVSEVERHAVLVLCSTEAERDDVYENFRRILEDGTFRH